MYLSLLTGTYFIVNDSLKPNSISTIAKKICLMNPSIYTTLCFFYQILVNICNIADINYLATNRKIVDPIQSSFYHVIKYKIV